MYRVMFLAPATKVTYVVEEVEARPGVQNGTNGWMVRIPGSTLPGNEVFASASAVHEDFDDADLVRSRWQREMDEYLAKKEMASR